MTEDSDAARGTILGAARHARRRNDWPALLGLATLLREQHPAEPDGFVLGLIALHRLGRAADAAALLAEALLRFPEHPRLLGLQPGVQPRQNPRQALSSTAPNNALQDALQRSDWPQLAELCRQLRTLNPDDPRGYQLGIRALRMQKQRRQADKLSQAAVAKFPRQAAMLHERAAVLQRQKRWDEAAACYTQLRDLLPNAPLAYARGAAVEIYAGRFDDAEALLAPALARWPQDLTLRVQSAVAASRRQDFACARARWALVREIAPDDPRLRSFEGSLAVAEQLDDLGPGTKADNHITDTDDAAVLRTFESLGGNCEFGLVQRVAGLEPLGLLRFAGITATELIAMLDSELAGVGDAAHTKLFLNQRQEYMLEDTRYFRTHTFISYGDADEADLLGKLRRRTAFLRDKLLAELRQGRKIFIFRPRDGLLEDDTIDRLHAATRKLGSATLVCVRNGDNIAVSPRSEGLQVATLPGHSSRLSLSFVETQRYAHWMALCRAVVASLAA